MLTHIAPSVVNIYLGLRPREIFLPSVQYVLKHLRLLQQQMLEAEIPHKRNATLEHLSNKGLKLRPHKREMPGWNI